jgi:rhamnogalacturonyl hydrolase YesR
MRLCEHWPSYTTDLVLEGLLALFDATGDTRHLDFVLRVWEFRGRPRDSLTIGNSHFTCLHLETYQRTGDTRFVEGLVRVAAEWRRTAPRTSEGAIAHRRDPFGAVLLDMLAGYAPLMAAAGMLSDDESYFDECALQCRLYRDILRDPATGLWHHARGWRTPGVLSPAGWCRGQGWAMRALVKSLGLVPTRHPAHTLLRDLLSELTADLLRFQQPSGMWHQLVDEPDSYPETSGTGFLVHALQVASVKGWFEGGADAAIRGAHALAEYVDRDGALDHSCMGTPPLDSVTDYRRREYRRDDPHGIAAVLLALAAKE